MPDDTNILPRDQNHVTAAGFESDSTPGLVLPGQIDEGTGRVKVDSPSGSGTVTSFSFTDANGFAGTVTNPTTTPDLSIEITASGILKGVTGAIASAVAGTDYVAPGAVTTSGLTMATNKLLGRSTAGTGAIEEIAVGTGLSLSGGTLSTTGGSGDVVGPASATDNAVARFDGTTGKLIQNSAVTIADTTGDITAGKYNGLTITASTGTLTIANGKTLTANSSLTLAGTDGKTLTVSNSGTLAGGDAFVLAIAAGKTLTVSNTLTFTGTDGSSVAFGTGGTVLYTASTIPLTVGTTTIASGTNTRILYDNNGVLGEYTLTGTGTVVAMQTAPSFLTSITTPSVLASSNDSGALGASGTAFADLFLASGGVINWTAGDYTLTHSTGVLTANKDLRVTTVGTNSASVVTVGGTQTLTSKTLTSPAITTASLSGTQLLAEGASIGLDPAGSADGAYSGITITATAGYTQAFGDLVYLAVADSRWELADADAAATAGPVALAMVVVAGTDGNPCTLLLQGTIRADAKFPTMTVGATQYVGETAGAIQGSIPTGADNIIRTVGYALTADEIYFNPSTDWQVTVA